jgi:hypothetical protein
MVANILVGQTMAWTKQALTNYHVDTYSIMTLPSTVDSIDGLQLFMD